MYPYFQEMLQHLANSGVHMVNAVNEMKQAAELAIHANEELEDIRTTVERLEKLVIELVEKNK